PLRPEERCEPESADDTQTGQREDPVRGSIQARRDRRGPRNCVECSERVVGEQSRTPLTPRLMAVAVECQLVPRCRDLRYEERIARRLLPADEEDGRCALAIEGFEDGRGALRMRTVVERQQDSPTTRRGRGDSDSACGPAGDSCRRRRPLRGENKACPHTNCMSCVHDPAREEASRRTDVTFRPS